MEFQVECRSDYEYAQIPRSWREADRQYIVRRVIQEARTPDEKKFLVETMEKERYWLCYRPATDRWTVTIEDKKGSSRV
jgi:hypothetical protein